MPREQDVYLIGVLRALDRRIDEVRAQLHRAAVTTPPRAHLQTARHNRLVTTLDELQEARDHLLNAVFRAPARAG